MGRKRHGLLVLACVLLCVAVLASRGHGASLSVVKSINDIWGNVAMQAAEVGDAQRVLRGGLHLGLVTSCLSPIAPPVAVIASTASLAKEMRPSSQGRLLLHQCWHCCRCCAAAVRCCY
jgi:hypothetical protein